MQLTALNQLHDDYNHTYLSRATLFGTPAPDDPLLSALRRYIQALRERAPGATGCASLGFGNHADRQISYAAALDSATGALTFYQGFPYVARRARLVHEYAKSASAVSIEHKTMPSNPVKGQNWIRKEEMNRSRRGEYRHYSGYFAEERKD